MAWLKRGASASKDPWELRDELDEEATRELRRRIRCPVLVIQGTDDAITGPGCGIALAEATGGQLVLLEGHRRVKDQRLEAVV